MNNCKHDDPGQTWHEQTCNLCGKDPLREEIVHLRAALDMADKSDRESIAMYHRARNRIDLISNQRDYLQRENNRLQHALTLEISAHLKTAAERDQLLEKINAKP